MFWFFTQITSLSSPDTKTSQMKQPFLPLSEANPLAQAVLTSPTSTQSASSVMPCAPGSGSWLCPSLGPRLHSVGQEHLKESPQALCHKPPCATSRPPPSPAPGPARQGPNPVAPPAPGHRRNPDTAADSATKGFLRGPASVPFRPCPPPHSRAPRTPTDSYPPPTSCAQQLL